MSLVTRLSSLVTAAAAFTAAAAPLQPLDWSLSGAAELRDGVLLLDAPADRPGNF